MVARSAEGGAKTGRASDLQEPAPASRGFPAHPEDAPWGCIPPALRGHRHGILAQLVLLKEAAAKDMAVCLDGSPGAYYFRPGNQSNKWYIHHQGGGWCESMEDCYDRSKTDLGSSTKYPPQANLGGGYFDTNPEVNPMMYDWNAVFMKYCDGASFAGSNSSTESINGVTLHWRGHHILNAIMDDLFTNHNLGAATDVVVSGCSAGGLATYLHTDEWADRIHEANPNTHVVGMPDSGFFIDVENPIVVGKEPEEGAYKMTIPGNYHDGLKFAATTQNVTSGVNQDCVAAHSKTGDEWMCMFAEHGSPFIKTPIFILQSQYDSWQTGHVLGPNATDDLINQMGKNITQRLNENLFIHPQHSGFVDSCHHHCGMWAQLQPVNGDQQPEAFFKWYYNLTATITKPYWYQADTYPCTACCSA